jgi:ectoine hydroxylase-related dioxygenase (phytanoyl-CoA dioxygenase family)
MELAERFGGQWATTSYRMGDVITFGMYTMHASTTNLTNRFRLSCDVRFQPESEDVDPRWVGERPVAHGTYGQQPLKPIAVAREEWGL